MPQQHKKGCASRLEAHPFCLCGIDCLSLKVSGDFLHPLHLMDVEGAAGITVAAGKAVRGLDTEVVVVVPGQRVARSGKVVVLVDETDVQPRWARLAVVAVDAFARDLFWGQGTDHRVVLLLVGGVKEAENPLQICAVTHTRQHRHDTGAVQCVLDALALGHRLSEGRGLCIEQLAAR